MEKTQLTGYPNVDRPWMKYYDESKINPNYPQKTLFDYMKEKSFPAIELPAITYYGKKISYGELYENIETAAQALTSYGVVSGDRILYLVPNIPEAAYTFYGTTQIGAVADYIDPRPDSLDFKVSAQKVLSMIIREKIKHIVCLDQCYLAMIKPIENELKSLGINKVILINAQDSMSLINKINYLKETKDFNGLKFLKQKLSQGKIIDKKIKEAIKSSVLEIVYYKDLVAQSRYTKYLEEMYEPAKLAAIVHTSGTTSLVPKAIPLTHDNINGYVHQSFFANMPMQYGDKALHILPYFAAYGLTNNVHSGFCHGTNMIQIPEFMPANLGELIQKYKPQTIMGVPSWFTQLINDPALRYEDLSFLRMVTTGGDSISPQDEKRVNEFFKSHNSSVVVTKGHGMSETSGCSSFAGGEYNAPGSIGIPLPLLKYGFVNPETKELLKFEEGQEYIEGEMIISGQTVTQGVLDGKTIVPHKDYFGEQYIFTNDIARMNRDGIMTFLSRNDRTFSRFDGFKYRSYIVEELLKTNEEIRDCVIVPYFDEGRKGNMPIAYIILNIDEELTADEEERIIRYLLNKNFIQNEHVSSRQIPSKFRILKEFPTTKNGKTDFKELERIPLDGEEIDVDINESNISVYGIEVLKNKRKKKLVKIK